MNMRRRAGLTGAALAALAVPLLAPSTASAAPGWQHIGTSGFTYWSGGVYVSEPVESGGGGFQACVFSDAGSQWYQLYEYDPSNADEPIGGRRYQVEGGCETWDGIDAYADGDNNKAELFLRTDDGRAYKVDYYD
ncbi:hypothetical protein ACI2L4_11135 [Streptomyces sparsogenes]|uniref:hypothetical protein n=1 Tax=Streptomyces sparsogenes TaxID=67365 RepID=UPI0033DDA313